MAETSRRLPDPAAAAPPSRYGYRCMIFRKHPRKNELMTTVNSDGPAPPVRILVIDDEVQIRRFLRISLASQGYEVLEAATAGEGLELAATRMPGRVVLDLGLPGADGKAILEEIRSWSSMPVIILS